MKNDQDKITRLAWEPVGPEEADHKSEQARPLRALPAGTYTLTGYRLVRSEWFISVILAHHDQHKIKVRPGKVTSLKIDPTIHVSCKADTTSKYIVRSFFKGMHGAGLTIYKNGKRIPLGFKITAPSGRPLECKAMKYG